ncbi:hypothetical protein DPMN_126199 [Dreissena polymorpha]|uniref:Uncharacterized protein n=1 Tax=Dreissena polymorpha TaxID=45954 RepID=A0A9D4GVN6_DREPO|nr:hypothetical protein DPMN_126199 [Dreissena polymorpha]
MCSLNVDTLHKHAYGLLQLDVQLILTGADRHPEKGVHSYQQYLDHLWQVGQCFHCSTARACYPDTDLHAEMSGLHRLL